jgi:hypothetical protein
MRCTQFICARLLANSDGGGNGTYYCYEGVEGALSPIRTETSKMHLRLDGSEAVSWSYTRQSCRSVSSTMRSAGVT